MKSVISLFLMVCVLNLFSQHKTCGKKSAHQYQTIQTTQSSQYLDLANKYDLHAMAYDLQLSALNKNIQGGVVLHVKPWQNIDTLVFELHANFIIDSLFINTVQLFDVTRQGHEVFVHSFFNLIAGQSYALRIYYHGTAPGGNTWGSGFVNTSALGYLTTYSLSAPYYMHEWSPCKQVLSDLIDSVSMRVTTDTAFAVSSNGLRTSDMLLGSGKHQVTWQTHYPINYYLISVNVGTHVEYNYQVLLSGMTDSMLIQNFMITPGSVSTKKAILDTIDDFLAFFSDKFGLYPFYEEKFGVCQVNLQGGMEHQTLVNLSHSFDYYLTAHEMAHQWWGDALTVDNLHDMWLNEGFASYCEFLIAERYFPTQAAGIMNTYHATAKSNANQRVYVDDLSSFNSIYNGMVYEKGAAILHTLRYLIGNDSLFFSAMASYHLSHQFGLTNLNVFQDHMEAQTGVDLNDFMQEWYYGYGFPKYSVRWIGQGDSLYLTLRHQSTSLQTPIFHLPLPLRLIFANGTDSMLQFPLQDTVAWFQQFVPMADSIVQIEVDPLNYIVNSVVSITKDSLLLSVSERPSVQEKGLMVFPNPAQSDISLKTNASRGNLKIYNASGQLVLAQAWRQGQNVRIQGLPAGVYFVELQDYKGLLHKARLVK